MFAVLAVDAFLDRVAVDLARDLAAELPHVLLDVVAQRCLKNRPAQKFGRGVSGHLANVPVHAQETAVRIDFDDAGRNVVIGRRWKIVAGANPTRWLQFISWQACSIRDGIERNEWYGDP